jgi:prepilin-type processing-associated H-X9-DG protein
MNARLSFLRPGSLDDCTSPTETIALVESTVPDAPGNAVGIPAVSFIGREMHASAFRHSGKMNVCFADGHVKLTGAEKLV